MLYIIPFLIFFNKISVIQKSVLKNQSDLVISFNKNILDIKLKMF